jgi:Tfp pilus assembly protein PilF
MHASALLLKVAHHPLVAFYLGASVLFAISLLLLGRNSFYTRTGGSEYESRMRWRLAGWVMLAMSAVVLGIGLLKQFGTDNVDVPVAGSSLAGQSQPAPVARPPVIAPSLLQTPPPDPSAPAQGTPPQAEDAPSKSGPPDLATLRQQTPDSPSPDSVKAALMDAVRLLAQNKLDDALNAVNAIIQSAPKNPDALSLRGNIYAEKKQWDQARQDLQGVLQLDSGNVQARFNLGEIDFINKRYDSARPAFLALEKDANLGDLATYKVFLCDLLGAHEDVAASELATFNQIGENASYYFANVAWSAYHQKTEDARSWLESAKKIYAPRKFNLYATSLRDLGYLPLPPPPGATL